MVRLRGSGTPATAYSYSIAYDAVGNVTAYNDSVNGGSGLTYDASGDVTQDSENQYLYDADGHVCATYGMLTHMMTGYLYDAEGNRVAKGPITTFSCDTTSNGFGATGSDNLYILGPGGQQLTEMTWSGGVALFAATNVSAAGELIASYTGSQVALNFQLRDWLGTLRVETDSGGTAQENCESLPYGNGETCATPPYLFTGKERDAESGNDYFGARYFASNMGRFITPDWSAKAEPVPYAKMGDPQSLNLYAYVVNSPLDFVDLSGHQSPGTSVVLPICDINGGGPFDCYDATIKAQEPTAPMRLFHLPDDPHYSASVSGIGGGCSMSDSRCQQEYEFWYNASISYYANQRKTLAPNNTQAAAWKKFGNALVDCAKGSAGTAGAGAGLVAAGSNVVSTAGKFAGSTPGTSIASQFFRSVFPQAIDSTWAPTLMNPLATSGTLGGVIGRWVPVVGEGLLIYSGVKYMSCVYQNGDNWY